VFSAGRAGAPTPAQVFAAFEPEGAAPAPRGEQGFSGPRCAACRLRKNGEKLVGPYRIPTWHVTPLGVGANHQRDNQGEEKRSNQE
jgi:hypothetical protein